MNVTRTLLDILVVLFAAKLAAEAAERAKVPAVVGEILAGVAIGPSALGLVHGSEVLRVLGELGVILLLLQVGLEMDLAELGAVGRASLAVAAVGVIVPFGAGAAVASAAGMEAKVALFVGAALSATSVGITARVFGDLRALTMVEARTVLGAAVADDVIGLVILTVVVRLVSEGSVSIASVAGVVGVAVAFLAVTSFVGVRAAPGTFSAVARHSRSSGTLVALALAFTLGVSELASASRLAPIVGAFVAGLSMARSPAAERIRRELTPVGHLFIPVFFLQIGIDTRLGELGRAGVLALAAGLLAVAILGKLVSAAGLGRSPGDRLLVGVGMIPRGEVGLIFATLGLRQRVFGEDVYAALILVVLATTLLTPPLLRWRILAMRAGRRRPPPAGDVQPAGGWLHIEAEPGGGTVELAAEPPPGDTLEVALHAALLGGEHRPGPRLLDWLGGQPTTPLRWNDAARRRFFDLLEHGGPRSWRFLALTDVLERALPELASALARRQADPFELDPTGALRWPRLARLGELGASASLEHPERVLLAALVLDAVEDDEARVPLARRIVARLDLGAGTEQAVAGLVADAGLLRAAARRADGFSEEAVLQLAAHLGSPEQARGLLALTLAGNDLDPVERLRVEELHDLVQGALAHPELTSRTANNVVEQRRAEAARLATDPHVRERIAAAPRAYVLAQQAPDIARHAALCEPAVGADTVRVAVSPVDPTGEWRVEMVARDRVGLLARESRVLAEAGADIVDATIATWGDGTALGSFRVRAAPAPQARDLQAALERALGEPLSSPPVPEARVVFDDDGSPWHTLCRVEAADRRGLLAALTAAFATAGASVHSARVATLDGAAVDLFELTDAGGHKLDPSTKERVLAALARGVETRRARARLRRPGRQGGQEAERNSRHS